MRPKSLAFFVEPPSAVSEDKGSERIDGLDAVTARHETRDILLWVVEGLRCDDKSEIGKPGDFAHLTDEEVEAALMAELRARGLSEQQARALLEDRPQTKKQADA
jgi:hypothetical protein